MSVDDVVKLINAIAQLLSVVIWPGVIVFILLCFGQDIRKFLSSLSELTLKGAGFEASLKKKQAEITAALAAAVTSKSTTQEDAVQEARITADIVAEAVTPAAIKKASRSSVLWVDDLPDNNIYERQALEVLGIRFVLAASTDEALTQMSRRRFNTIISDMDALLTLVQVTHFSISFDLWEIKHRLSSMRVQDRQNTLLNHVNMVLLDVQTTPTSYLRWFCSLSVVLHNNPNSEHLKHRDKLQHEASCNAAGAWSSAD